MISIQQDGPLTIAAVFAEFTVGDFKRIEEEIVRQVAAQERVQLLLDLRDMLGVTIDVALEDIRFARAHAHDSGRVAILSERDAVTWAALLAQWLVDAQIKVFDDEPLARAWLAGEDV